MQKYLMVNVSFVKKIAKMKLPPVFEKWIMENGDPSWVNNSRDIYRRQLTFLYGKWKTSKNEFWAGKIEDMTGISYDYKQTDCVGNN